MNDAGRPAPTRMPRFETGSSVLAAHARRATLLATLPQVSMKAIDRVIAQRIDFLL
jgi:hypothetical protein